MAPGMHSCTYALDSTWRPLLKDLGVSSANVLRRSGLAEDLLSRSGVRLEAADFHRFWESIDAELGDPLLPLKMCQSVRSESFSPPLFAALCSPNWLVAMQRIARYKALVAPMRLEVREGDEWVSVELVWPEKSSRPPVSLVITELLFMVTLARIGTRERLRPLSVVTSVPLPAHDDYAEFLGLHFQGGTRHCVAFSRGDAVTPFLTSNDGLWAAFEPELRTRLVQLDASLTVGQRVRSALLEALPGGGLDMDAVASRIGLSRRTLQRHLEVEGLTYTDLLQSTRHALAIHYLLKTELPAGEISFLLGFEEVNSFFRAFREWTQKTPEQFRNASRPLKETTQLTAPNTDTRINEGSAL